MVLLRCYEQYRDFARIEDDSGRITFLPRMELEQARKQEINGVYARSQEGFVAFYRVGPRLFFQLNERILMLSEDVRCEVRQMGQTKTLDFYQSTELLFSWTYEDPLREKWFENDPTPMVEKEDFDLGILVRNVLRSEGRKKRIFPNGLIGHDRT
jgi:hypothetical protein